MLETLSIAQEKLRVVRRVEWKDDQWCTVIKTTAIARDTTDLQQKQFPLFSQRNKHMESGLFR